MSLVENVLFMLSCAAVILLPLILLLLWAYFDFISRPHRLGERTPKARFRAGERLLRFVVTRAPRDLPASPARLIRTGGGTK